MAKVNGVRLFYELNGTGEVPLVLVHKILGLAQRLGPMTEDQGIESELFSDLPEARQWLLAGNLPKDNAESS
jgi:hypothetical protein